MSASPIGDLCILKDPRCESWSVAICWGGIRECLRSFDSLAEAHDFAVAERNRRFAQGERLIIHCPDDCPCYGSDQAAQT